MSAQPASANLHSEPGSHIPGSHVPGPHVLDPHAADAHYYRQVLHELIDMGTGFARLLHQQATAQAQAAPQDSGMRPAPPSALGVAPAVTAIAAFDRIARTIRRSIALARSLTQPVPRARDPARHRAAARKRILREVEDTIQRTAPGPGHAASRDAALRGSSADHADADPDDASAEALTAELHDRLDTPDLDDDISSRPVADIITEICRDLGLATLPGAHPWKRRTPQDLEQLRARAAAPSHTRSPIAGLPVPTISQRAPTSPVPPRPAAIPRAAGPAHTGSGPPDDPGWDRYDPVPPHVPARPMPPKPKRILQEFAETGGQAQVGVATLSHPTQRGRPMPSNRILD